MAVLLALGALVYTVAAPLPHERTTTLLESMFYDMLPEDCRDNYKLLFEEPLGDVDECFGTLAAYHFFEDYDPYFSYYTN